MSNIVTQNVNRSVMNNIILFYISHSSNFNTERYLKIQGSKYVPSKNPQKICCGECVPVACIVQGAEKKIGEEWTSDDFCTKYLCLNKNGTV
jgi:hypothetical protein